MAVNWAQALAWRLERHLLDPVGTESVAGVVGRLCAVPAQSGTAAELAIRVRRQRSRQGEVARALSDGTIIKTFAFRGATHLLTPEDGGNYLALRASSRMWELPSWCGHYGLEPADWPPFREAVREALADGPLTPRELTATVTRTRRFEHLAPFLDDRAGTLHKPLAWQGDLTFGPVRDGQATFQGLADNPRWAGIPDLEDAGRHAVAAYFRAYGPATTDHVHRWLGNGLGAGRKSIRSWIEGYGDELAAVDVEGESCLIFRDDVESLVKTSASREVRLLPGYDQWVLGPGTDNAYLVPSARRTPVSRGANLVLSGGVVSGSWDVKDSDVVISWFAEAGRVPRQKLEAEADRLMAIRGGDLRVSINKG